jgi:hypothetical protein
VALSQLRFNAGLFIFSIFFTSELIYPYGDDSKSPALTFFLGYRFTHPTAFHYKHFNISWPVFPVSKKSEVVLNSSSSLPS